MKLEINVLLALHQHRELRSAEIGHLLNTPGKKVLGTLNTLKQKDFICEDVNDQWSLTSMGTMYLNSLRAMATSPASVSPLPTDDHDVRMRIVNRSVEARTLVTAGPGMGKTYLACERVLKLIEGGVKPESILFLGFSRAAVHVIRQRTASSAIFDHVHTRTLDSLGVALHGEAVTGGNYLESIVRALDTRERWADVVRARYSHVIVDEAQDIRGDRARLVIMFLEALDFKRAGFTVFCDPAQAIYDFTQDDKTSIKLVDELMDSFEITRDDLSVIYRSKSPELLSLMQEARTQALRDDYAAIAKLVVTKSKPYSLEEVPSGELWLFRSRAEVCNAIFRANLDRCNVTVHLRMGGSAPPVNCLLPTLLGESSWPYMTRDDVHQIEARHGSTGQYEKLFDAALVHARHKKDQVDLKRFVKVLCQQRIPEEFEEVHGEDTLTLSVIHASKGMEAKSVRYFHQTRRNQDPEEARVIHVAISRATQELHIHKAWYVNTYAGDQNRTWTTGKKRRMLIHSVDDVDPVYRLGVYMDCDPEIQTRLKTFEGSPRRLTALFDGTRYVLAIEGDEQAVVGALSPGVMTDVEARFGQHFSRHGGLGGLYLIGVSSNTCDPEMSVRGVLRAPYHRTRTWLVPIVAGLALPYLPKG